jgi:hypothetical protein
MEKTAIPENRRGESFDIKVTKSETEYLLLNNVLEDIMCKEYGQDDDWIGVTKEDLDENGYLDDEYKTFEIDTLNLSDEKIIEIINELNLFNSLYELTSKENLFLELFINYSREKNISSIVKYHLLSDEIKKEFLEFIKNNIDFSESEGITANSFINRFKYDTQLQEKIIIQAGIYNSENNEEIKFENFEFQNLNELYTFLEIKSSNFDINPTLAVRASNNSNVYLIDYKTTVSKKDFFEETIIQNLKYNPMNKQNEIILSPEQINWFFKKNIIDKVFYKENDEIKEISKDTFFGEFNFFQDDVDFYIEKQNFNEEQLDLIHNSLAYYDSLESYEVEIVENLSKIITVKAESFEEAKELVIENYNEAKIILDSQDFVFNEFKNPKLFELNSEKIKNIFFNQLYPVGNNIKEAQELFSEFNPSEKKLFIEELGELVLNKAKENDMSETEVKDAIEKITNDLTGYLSKNRLDDSILKENDNDIILRFYNKKTMEFEPNRIIGEDINKNDILDFIKEYIREDESNRKLAIQINNSDEIFLSKDDFQKIEIDLKNEGNERYTLSKVNVKKEIETNFSSDKLKEIIAKINNLDILNLNEDNKYLFIDKINDIRISFSSELEKQKLLSDIWAAELSKTTDLSFMMTSTQIDEKQAEHYRKYEILSRKFGLPINPLIEENNNKFYADSYKNLFEEYCNLKEKYSDTIFFIKDNDNYYKTFNDDANKVADVLKARAFSIGNDNVVLSLHSHMMDQYLKQIVNTGYKVATTETTFQQKSISDKLVEEREATAEGFSLNDLDIENDFTNTLIEDIENKTGSLWEKNEEIDSIALENLSNNKEDVILTQAENLPEGWTWRDYDDGSGSILNPKGNPKFSYDLMTQEYKSTEEKFWRSTPTPEDGNPITLNYFKKYIEDKILKEIDISKQENLEGGKIKDLAEKIKKDPSLINTIDSNTVNILNLFNNVELEKKLSFIELNYFEAIFPINPSNEDNVKLETAQNLFNSLTEEQKTNLILEMKIKLLNMDNLSENPLAYKSIINDLDQHFNHNTDEELYRKIDLFEMHPSYRSDELNSIIYRYGEKDEEQSLDYLDLENFKQECEKIGFTFDYSLDAEPYSLRPINEVEQYQLLEKFNNINNQNPKIMENSTKQQEQQELKVGRIASVNTENGLFKGAIESINGDDVTLKNLKNETITTKKNDVYQFFHGQKFDYSELSKMIENSKELPEGLSIKDIKGKDLHNLLKGNISEGLLQVEKKDKTMSAEFKLQPLYNSESKQMEVKAIYKNPNELNFNIFGEKASEEQIKKLQEGEKVAIDRSSKNGKEFTAQVYLDKELNQIIFDKFIDKTKEPVQKETASKKLEFADQFEYENFLTTEVNVFENAKKINPLQLDAMIIILDQSELNEFLTDLEIEETQIDAIIQNPDPVKKDDSTLESIKSEILNVINSSAEKVDIFKEKFHSAKEGQEQSHSQSKKI